MTQLIAHLKQIAVGDGVQPSQVHVMARVAIAFTIGVVVAALLI